MLAQSGHLRDQAVRAKCAVLITSDTRTREDDESGMVATRLLAEAGHQVVKHEIVKNEKSAIKACLSSMIEDGDLDMILTSGGTGISSRDHTADVAISLMERQLEGFGEVFRRLSYEELGSFAIMSRATAGISKGKLLFCIPGSKNAMRLALLEIIIPILGHAMWELRR